MPEARRTAIEQLLQQSSGALSFLTRSDAEGRWREAFGPMAARVPQPYWLYADDEQTPLILGFPFLVSGSWESLGRELGRLVEAEAEHRCRVALHEEDTDKGALIEQRAAFARRLAELLENALLHDYGRRLPELFWLVFSREVAEHVGAALRSVFPRTAQLSPLSLDEIRYSIARRVADVSYRGELEALARLRRWAVLEPQPISLAFSKRLREDLLPFAEHQVGRDMRELDAYLQGHLSLDPQRFHRLLARSAALLDRLRQRDASFDRVLSQLDPEAASLSCERLLFSRSALNLLEVWSHPDAPRLSAELLRLLRDIGDLLKRFEVLACLRRHIFPVGLQGSRPVTRIHGQFASLSVFTRPVDFATPGVVDSAVRRYGLLYDMVEFTQLLADQRRRGRVAEEQAMRFMVQFQRRVEEIRARHRLKFEKFLGDGAFYSARSARAVLLAASELRILYERLRHQGFPFDRGLRLALNVGAYHLLPMTSEPSDLPHFEFFGHGLVELARLTTGKATHEVDDIADFLIASGYPVQKVLEFLEPVRQTPRYPEHVKDRPYAAFLAENGELVNLGGVATEAFLHDLEGEWAGLAVAEGTRYGLSWLLLPCDPARTEGPWIGLRFLGSARLKGMEPLPLAEVVLFEQPPVGMKSFPEGTPLWETLKRLAGAEAEEITGTPVPSAPSEIDAELCVASAFEDAATRAWYLGLYRDGLDALVNAFRIPLEPEDLRDGEPFEAWLFRRREELATLYQGLRRDGSGAAVPLENLRTRDGYLTCLLAAPHRSPR
jgi:hypothetical protein